MINSESIKCLRSKIVESIGRLEVQSHGAKLELMASSEVNNSVLMDEIDSAKAETDLRATAQVHNHAVIRQVELRNALSRIDTGTFGHCRFCGGGINVRRLEAHPGATLCIECQEDREMGWLPAEPSQNYLDVQGNVIFQAYDIELKEVA